MSEEAQQHEGERPVALIKKIVVTEILGHIQAEGIEIEKGGSPNSTRWVFDVECKEQGTFSVQLVRHLDGRNFETDIEPSFHFTALSRQFHDAKVWGKTEGSALTVHVGGACRFRVDMDAIGSNRR